MGNLCGKHYAGDPDARDCPLIHRSRLAAEREDAKGKLLEEVAHSITSALNSERTVEDPRQAAEYVVNLLTVHRTDLLRELARLFT